MKSYTVLRNQFATLTNNTAPTNLTLGDQLINDSLRYLTTKYFFNERSQVVPGGTVAGTQDYPMPYNWKTIINLYVLVGNIRYQLTETPTRQFWDSLNFVTYTSDIPQYYFIYNNRCYIFPIPASSGNTIEYNYKIRLRDLSQADVTGTGSVTTLTSVITGTSFVPDMVGRWIRFDAPSGDENWYQIGTYVSATEIHLINQYQGNTVTSGTYTIGEMPILGEDYHDLPVYRACSVYFTTRVPDPTRAELFDKLYKEGEKKLDEEFGSKSNSVAVTPADVEVTNPNLFIRNLT